ncbi:MAG: hypothetical protein AAFX45_08235 [Pseudomonadota bacterium]
MANTIYIAVREDAPFDPARTAPTKAETRRDLIAAAVAPLLQSGAVGRQVGTAKVTAFFGTEDGRAGNFTRVGDDPMAEQVVRAMLDTADGALGAYGVAAVFECDDLMIAEYIVHDTAIKAGHADAYVVHCAPDTASDAPMSSGAPYKSIEIYYDVDDIPGDQDPIEFREAACAVIEGALMDADAGEWAGSESGAGEVNFGFEVSDFERAEKIVRAAVQGTPYAAIREITRYSDPEDTIAAE